MERIQQAIEKARLQRERRSTTSSQNSYSSSLSFFKEGKQINYTSTRKIQFTDEQLKEKLLVGGFAHDPRSEPYRQLRSQVLRKLRGNNWRSFAVTSPNQGNGKTLTAINLAISLSQEVNQTVLLVDLDLRNPSFIDIFELTESKGIVDCAVGNCTLESILFNPGYERLVLAPTTPQGHQTSEILSSPQMQSIFEELKNRYEDRIIIFDLPALLTSDDALVFTPFVDAILLVIEEGGSTKDDIKRSLGLLDECNLIGSVINNAY